MTPQRLHAELLAVGAAGLEAYVIGALCDGTYSSIHRTFRICQSEVDWLYVLQDIFSILGCRSWVYREGRDRNLWVIESSAPFLHAVTTTSFASLPNGLHYVRGYFDADGGMPRRSESRLYVQFCQKDRQSLAMVKTILEHHLIDCGRIYNPSQAVDPDYWRVFVATASHQRFLRLMGSWHPRKRQQIKSRLARDF